VLQATLAWSISRPPIEFLLRIEFFECRVCHVADITPGGLAHARKAAAVTIEDNADRHAANVLPIIREIQKAGATSLRAIAEALNARGIATARGGRWQAMTVSNLLARMA
jgi:hypothetical protein